MERLVEEYSDTEVFQNFESISVDTDLICLDADHTNYSILIQLAKKGVNVLCQGLWNVENYLDVIREFKRNNKFVIEDESFLNFEKVSIFVDIAKKLLAFDPAAEIEIKTNCFNIYAAVRILGMFLPNMQQMTVEQHVEQDSKEWVWCRLRNKIVVFEIDKKIYYGLERKYTAKSVEFNIQTDRGNLSLRSFQRWSVLYFRIHAPSSLMWILLGRLLLDVRTSDYQRKRYIGGLGRLQEN